MALKIRKNSDLTYVRRLSPVEGAKIYSKLRSDVTSAGILDRDYPYYVGLSLIDISGFLFFGYQLIVTTHPLLVIASTIGLSIFTVRFGGLIHDAGHRAIFKSTVMNDIAGYFLSLFVAFPFLVWKVKHNLHHAHTNEEGGDPDLEVPISFTEDMLNRKGLIVSLMRKYQAWLFYPLGSFVSITMRFKAFRYYKDNFESGMALPIVFQSLGMILWFVLPFFFFPLWKALLFVFLTNEVAGFYMLNIFAPNHKGMPQMEKGVEISFLEHQIITARNIYSHWATDYAYMGLNYQIEHHLFPNCPRNKLHLISPYVLDICKRYNFAYTQMGPVESGKFIVTELHKASKSIGTGKKL